MRVVFLPKPIDFMSKEPSTQTASSQLDTVKLVAALAVLVLTLVGYYTFDQMHAVVRVLGLVAGAAVAVFIFYQTTIGKSWFQYLSHAKREVRQVVWPTRPETVQMTLIVFVVVILMGIFLWLVDMFFLWAVKLLTGQGG
jgi:preprotein translocase subunit SecE